MNIWHLVASACAGIGLFLFCLIVWAGLYGRFHEACNLCERCGKRPWRYQTADGKLCRVCYGDES